MTSIIKSVYFLKYVRAFRIIFFSMMMLIGFFSSVIGIVRIIQDYDFVTNLILTNVGVISLSVAFLASWRAADRLKELDNEK